MLLTIDIGNTNIKFGVFDDENLIDTFRLPSDRDLPQNDYESLIGKLIKNYDIDGCIIGSVVNELTMGIKQCCDNILRLNTMILNSNLSVNIRVDVKNPVEMGADRVANAVAAVKRYSAPLIVVDVGTATTFDIVSKDLHLHGGIIMPGIGLQLKALNLNTSKLPKIDATKSENLIGNDTKSSILSGVIRGTACSICGLIEQCKQELEGDVTTILTGGYGSLLAEYMPQNLDYIDTNLTLQGLNYIYRMNIN
ncbi:MAG: type III pantothenate kinase [bacterium]|nr:type III pantothenate kinase [bacterium]